MMMLNAVHWVFNIAKRLVHSSLVSCAALSVTQSVLKCIAETDLDLDMTATGTAFGQSHTVIPYIYTVSQKTSHFVIC